LEKPEEKYIMALMPTSHGPELEVFLPVKDHQDYRDFLPICLEGILRNVAHPIRRIHLVSPVPLDIAKFPRGPEYCLVSEDELEKKISRYGRFDWLAHPDLSTRWVRQQIFKLHCFLLSPAEHFLVVDADLCFLKEVRFTDEQGRYRFYMENECFEPYFRAIHRLLGIKKAVDESFISDHMLFCSVLLREMLQSVEDRSGRPFLESLASALKEQPEGFRSLSEYEMYGTYLLHRHPERVGDLVPNPYFGLLHFFLPHPAEWSYEEIRSKLRHSHYFLPMMPTDKRPVGYPPLSIESTDYIGPG
jgi:hypothetical protein